MDLQGKRVPMHVVIVRLCCVRVVCLSCVSLLCDYVACLCCVLAFLRVFMSMLYLPCRLGLLVASSRFPLRGSAKTDTQRNRCGEHCRWMYRRKGLRNKTDFHILGCK